MLVVETIARIRRDHLVKGVPIKKIARDLRVSKNTVRKVVRGDETSFSYARKIQPMPKLGPWEADIIRLLLLTHQVIDHVSLVEPITKAVFRVEDGMAAMLADKAVAIASEGRPGPVLLHVPVDVQTREQPAPPPVTDAMGHRRIKGNMDIEIAVDMMRWGRRSTTLSCFPATAISAG